MSLVYLRRVGITTLGSASGMIMLPIPKASPILRSSELGVCILNESLLFY